MTNKHAERKAQGAWDEDAVLGERLPECQT